MAVIIQQTREELAVSVGYNLGVIRVGTLTDSGSVSTFNDDSLPNADSHIKGHHFRGTSGDNDGEIRTVDSYAGPTTIGTLRGDVLPAATADGDTYELWASDVPPVRVHDFINRAIRAIGRKGAPALEDLSLHSSLEIRTYTPPTTMTGIETIRYRNEFTFELIHNCDAVWETVDSDVTATLDDEFLREDSASNKFVIADGLAAGDIIAQDTIEQVDLSGMTHIEFWIYSTVTTTAGQLKLHLDDGTIQADGTDLESLDVPALTAREWLRVRVALANPELDTAIDNVGLEDDADIGAAIINIDGIIATRDDEGNWEKLHQNHWYLNQDARTFSLFPSGVQIVQHSMLKLLGRKLPTELNADDTNCDVEPEYIINRATALAIRATADRHSQGIEAAHTEARMFEALARDALAGASSPGDTRWFELS